MENKLSIGSLSCEQIVKILLKQTNKQTKKMLLVILVIGMMQKMQPKQSNAMLRTHRYTEELFYLLQFPY